MEAAEGVVFAGGAGSGVEVGFGLVGERDAGKLRDFGGDLSHGASFWGGHCGAFENFQHFIGAFAAEAVKFVGPGGLQEGHDDVAIANAAGGAHPGFHYRLGLSDIEGEGFGVKKFEDLFHAAKGDAEVVDAVFGGALQDVGAFLVDNGGAGGGLGAGKQGEGVHMNSDFYGARMTRKASPYF